MAQCLQFYTWCSTLGVNCYLYTDIKRTNPVGAGWVSDGTTSYQVNSSGMIIATAACQFTTYITLITSANIIKVSSDYGNTFATKSPGVGSEGLYLDVSMSASGQYQTVIDNVGYITYSQNYGASFTRNTAAGNRRWRCVAVSRYTGQYQIAGVNGGYLDNLYRSTNYGATWSVIGGFTGFWDRVAISGSGQYQLSGSSIDGYLYVSSNYGANWTAKTSLGTNWYNSFAISGNGQYQYAYSSGDSNYPANPHTFISSNYGSNWSILTTGPNFGVAGNRPSISTNETGQYVTIGKDNTVYVSSNYGASFTLVSLPSSAFISNVKMVSSGQIQILSISSSQSSPAYYISYNYGTTWSPSLLIGDTKGVDISEPSSGPSTPTYPAAGTFLYDQCIQCDLYAFRADGSGGVYQAEVLQYNTEACCTIDPGGGGGGGGEIFQ